MSDISQETQKPFKIGELVYFWSCGVEEGLYIVLDIQWDICCDCWVASVLSQRTGKTDCYSAYRLDPVEFRDG